MRFHQAISFLPVEQAVPMATLCDKLGYGGIYLSDHLFNPRTLESRYTYSTEADGSPMWDKDMGWPDPMVVFAGLATVTQTLTFTTGVYVAPVRDLITVAKTVGTAAVLSNNRIRLGVGVGWCKEEFDQTGQAFSTRGKRLDEMIPALRALWGGGWVEFHGEHYDVPACQMNPSPSEVVPIYGGGHSAPALRRTAELCDGWIAAGAYSEEEAWAHLGELRAALERAGRGDVGGSGGSSKSAADFAIYLSLGERPDLDMYRRFEEAGVTDLVCAPWMFMPVEEGASDAEVLAARLGACEWFAEHYVSKMV